MSAWPGKFVIGLTGNIATGKSVVRKMLEHLGAYGIDADALSHRAILKGAPGYEQVIDTFGKWIINEDEEIDRAKLGKLVFTNPEALKSLEEIVHPLVRVATDVLISRVNQKVIVIEAIKLIEGGMYEFCDSLWVSDTPRAMQINRLTQNRNLSVEEAQSRVDLQPPQKDKLEMADVVIRNAGTFENTWKQVVEAWRKTVPSEIIPTPPIRKSRKGELQVERARPRDAEAIADFINQNSSSKHKTTRREIYAIFGEKAILLLKFKDKIAGLLGWQVENLVARVTDMRLDPQIPLEQGMRAMISEVEKASRDLQCEACLLFLSPQLAQHEDVLQNLGYQTKTIRTLGVRAWQDAALESMPPGTVMLFKQLRKDRVLRPV